MADLRPSRSSAPLAPLIRLPRRKPGPPPRVVVAMALTADGRIATANRAFSRFGSPRDLARLYAGRAWADAVLCGATTLRAENATLEPSPARTGRRAAPPLRVVVTGRGTLPSGAAVFRRGQAPVLALITGRAPAAARERLRRVAAEVCVAGPHTVDWPRALAWLAERHGVRRVLCEGGSALNAALFRAGLVHELRITLCPWLVGGRRAPTLADGEGVARLTEGTRLELRTHRRVGDEVFLHYLVPDAVPPRSCQLPRRQRSPEPGVRSKLPFPRRRQRRKLRA